MKDNDTIRTCLATPSQERERRFEYEALLRAAIASPNMYSVGSSGTDRAESQYASKSLHNITVKSHLNVEQTSLYWDHAQDRAQKVFKAWYATVYT